MTARIDPNEEPRDRDEPASSSARPVPLPAEYERLALLHAVGRLLTDNKGLEVTWPLLLTALNGVMGLRTAVLITSFRGCEQRFTWSGPTAAPEDLRVAEEHAGKVLAFLNHAERDLAGDQGRQFITLPLLHGGRSVFGVLQLEGLQPLEERDVLLLNAVASELGTVVVGQYAWRQLGASVVNLPGSNRWLRKLLDLSSVALQSATLDEALPAVLRALCRLFGTDVAELVLLSDDPERGHPGREVKRASLGLPDAGSANGADELAIALRVAAAGCPMLFDEPRVLEQAGLTCPNAELCSIIAAPLRIAGRIAGVMWTATGKHPGFTRTELEVLDAVAEGLAPVIEHTRLLDEQRKLSTALAAQNDEIRRAQLERERMETRLQEVQRLESLGVLAGGIAHDFNNLLSVILGHATLGVGMLHNPEATRSSFGQIEAASLRAADLCKQMLSYSSRIRCERRLVALNQLLEDMTVLLRTSIQQGVHFHTELAPDLPTILADPSELTQLTMNLVINAAEAMEGGSGTVCVRTEVVHAKREQLEKLRMGVNLPEGDFVVLEVEDAGRGMNAATLDKMFEPFFTTKLLGRGLGLAVAFGVLRRHGAGLEVKSREGIGTSFRVWFPACTQPVAPVLVEPALHSRRRLHGRVLLVDDDDAVRETTALVLRDLGFEVRQARGGAEAIAFYAQEPAAFAVVVLDLSMPGLSGRQVFEALKAIRPDVRVLLISGFSEEQMTSTFPVDVAPAAFVQKPLRREALRAELERLLEGEPISE